MEFHRVTPADREWIRTALKGTDRKNCEESFANLYTWGNAFGMEVAQVEGCLVCRLKNAYSLPIGINRDAAIGKAKELYENGRFVIFGLESQDFPYLERHFSHIRAEYDRRWSDYIYLRDNLENLAGKKLAAKRNHINAFEREYSDWHTEPITKDNMEAVRQFHNRWSQMREIGENLEEELDAAELMLENYFELGLEGLVLYAEQDIVAYSFGEPLTDETYCVHVEKALSHVRGAYPLINREFVRTYCKEYEFINREDDSGEKGLRKAKMSYVPYMIVHKYKAEMEK